MTTILLKEIKFDFLGTFYIHQGITNEEEIIFKDAEPIPDENSFYLYFVPLNKKIKYGGHHNYKTKTSAEIMANTFAITGFQTSEL